MNTKHRSLVTAFVLILPLLASAQPEQQSTGNSSSAANIFFTLLPIVLIAAFIWFFYGRAVRTNVQQASYFAELKRHNDKMEQSLERIAKALEDKNKNPA